jgi:hypothetical protein
MARLKWDKTGERFWETGVDRVVLYIGNSAEAWSGVTAINESPSGAEPTKIYADNVVYGVVMSPEENSLTIEAFQYPELFNRAIGRAELAKGAYVLQQDRVPVGLCWRSKIGSDLDKDVGYKLHIVPILYSSSSEDSSATINDSPEQKNFSWSATAIPFNVDEDHNTSSLVLDSIVFNKTGRWNALMEIEDLLYGTDYTDAKMPTISKILEIADSADAITDSNGNSILDSSNNIVRSNMFMTA